MADKIPWALKDAHILINSISEDAAKFGYHVALGGSVIVKGMSERDLDLYFLPLCNSKLPKAEPTKLVDWLAALWGGPMHFAMDNKPLFPEDEPVEQDEIIEFNGAPPPRVGRGVREAAAFYAEPPQLRGGAQGRVPAPPQQAGLRALDAQLNRAVLNDKKQGKPVDEQSISNHPYRHCLRFIKADGDRIDVYII